MAWTILLGAGLLETVWAIALTYTGGFTRLWPNLIEVSAAVTSFFMLSSALKSPPVVVPSTSQLSFLCGAAGRRVVRLVAPLHVRTPQPKARIPQGQAVWRNCARQTS